MGNYVSKACQKHFLRNVIPCQVICNNMEADPIPNELKDLKCLEKIDVGKDSVSKKKNKEKKTTEHVKGKFSKTKGTLCNVPIESVNICDILQPASN